MDNGLLSPDEEDTTFFGPRVREAVPTILNTVADFTPVVGDIKGGVETVQAFNEGDYVGASVNAVATALGIIPVVGDIAGKTLKAGARKLREADNIGLTDTPEALDTVVEAATVKPVKTEAPKKTVKAYKLFRTDPNKPDELFPLFVNADKSVETNKWVQAEIGPLNDGGKVKSKIGALAFRPGWHAGDYIAATHIGGKSTPNIKKPDYRPATQVWAEVEMPDDVDWQSIANQRARIKKDGTPDVKTAHITDQVPDGGFYRYKTNSNMQGNWLIGGSMKVNKKLSDVETKTIQEQTGIYDLPNLPDLIDQKGLQLEDLTQVAQKELRDFYPDKYQSLTQTGFALGGLATARKGITTEEGMEMAKKGFQLDDKKADLDKDGELSTYERKRGEAVQRAMDNDEVVEMAHGGMACTCGYGGDCGCGEGMMGPIGTTRAETMDDIEVMISEGEYVLPANVVRWHGLKHIMDMQDEAEAGLMMMHSMGLIQEVDPNEEGEEAEPDGEDIEDAEVQAADRAAEDEETYETPEGTEIELADGMDVEEEDLDIEEMETPYAKPFGTVTKRKVAIMAY